MKGDEVADRGVVELGHRPGLCGAYLLVRSARAPLGFWAHWCQLPDGHGPDHECECGARWSEAL